MWDHVGGNEASVVEGELIVEAHVALHLARVDGEEEGIGGRTNDAGG